MRQEPNILFISLEQKTKKQKNKKTQDSIAREEIETTAAGLCIFFPPTSFSAP